jgi:ferredoxin
MANWAIDKSDVPALLDELRETYQVYAPLRREGILSIDVVDDGESVVLDMSNTKQAPKEIFFPRSEVLFTYRDGVIVPPPQEVGQRVVVGMRPCDAQSSVLLDKVFDGTDYQDPYYVQRRENTILVGLACNTPSSTCFCTSVGGSPFSTEGLDLIWTDLGDHYLVEAITERGAALVAGASAFRLAMDEDAARKVDLAAAAERRVSGPDVQGVKEKLDEIYEESFWDAVHLKCLGCGICTYLCPTCHCFDIEDEGNAMRGQRVRNWDTCQFSLFTRHASGHNPRPSGKERMRQRVMHKFNYFVTNFGDVACVGCGRCVRECPVNLDIRVVLEDIPRVGEG